jgi:hypothetical protein
MESINGGKLFPPTYPMELGVCIETLQYFTGWADKIHGYTIPSGK